MGRAERIEARLKAGLEPDRLLVRDDSARHAGHAGWQPEGETHFRVEIVAQAFAGLTRLDRQRLVYKLLTEELESGLHALELVTRTPAEAGQG